MHGPSVRDSLEIPGILGYMSAVEAAEIMLAKDVDQLQLVVMTYLLYFYFQNDDGRVQQNIYAGYRSQCISLGKCIQRVSVRLPDEARRS